MSDDMNNRGEPDRSLISLSEPHEVSYWTHALGVTAEQLREAVSAVGNSAANVRRFIATNAR